MTAAAAIDWVAVARAGIAIDIGQLDAAARRALAGAVRRGELVRSGIRFAGCFARKTCWAASHDAVDRYEAAAYARTTLAVALDASARGSA